VAGEFQRSLDEAALGHFTPSPDAYWSRPQPIWSSAASAVRCVLWHSHSGQRGILFWPGSVETGILGGGHSLMMQEAVKHALVHDAHVVMPHRTGFLQSHITNYRPPLACTQTYFPLFPWILQRGKIPVLRQKQGVFSILVWRKGGLLLQVLMS
jgi:hypothetical protein